MARIDNLPNFLNDVANAIRKKNGSSGVISIAEFDNAIMNLPTTGKGQDYFMMEPTNNVTIQSLLHSIPEGLNTDGVTGMQYMFNGCSNLVTIDLDTLNTAAVTNMSNMFGYCTNLSSLDFRITFVFSLEYPSL